MIFEKLEPYKGKDVRIGKIPFEFVIDGDKYKFIAKTTNRFSIGEIEATPYNYTDEYADEPQTRVRVYHGGQTPAGFLESKLSEAYIGLFKTPQDYFSTVEELTLSCFE